MNKEVLETFELIEKALEEEYQNRKSQKELRIREGIPVDDFLIERLVGCLIGIRDIKYQVRMVKEQYDWELKKLRNDKEKEKLCASCEKCCEGFYHHDCEKWEELHKKVWGNDEHTN